MLRKKNLLVVISLLLLVLIIAGCGNIPKPTKGIIHGKVLAPPSEKGLTRDISGWVPAENAAVTIKDDKGVVHIANTDSEGNFSFENLTVKSNTIVTATVKIDGKTVVLKGLIDKAVAKDENYDVGTLTPESTALALVIERLSAEGKGIDLDKIKDAGSFVDLIDEINEVLESHGNVIDDKDVKDLIDKIMNELYPGGGGEPTPPSIIDVAFSSLAANGTSQTVTTTALTITFDKAVDGLSAGDFTVTGATKGNLSGTGPTYTLAISDITVADGGNVNVAVAKSGYKFTPANKDVVVYVKDISAPTIANSTTGKRDTTSTSTSITVPTGTQNGDLMVLIFTINGGTAPSTPQNWTQLASGTSGSYQTTRVTQAVYYRKLTGSISNFNVSHNSQRTSWILLRIPDGDIPRASSVATGQNRSPNPSSLTHNFGTGTDVLWIATAGWTRNNTVTGWPTNYNDNRISIIAGGSQATSGNSTAIATRTRTANSEDPGNFTLSGTGTSNVPYWCAFTLAIKRQ